MKKIIIILVTTFISATLFAQVPDEYSISCAGNAVEGNYMVSVSYKAKSKKPDDMKLRLAAVHGVIFRGFSSDNRTCAPQQPLAKDPSVEQSHSSFFLKFFDGSEGDAAGFANVQSGSYEIMKVKKGYKITAVVIVSKDKLRKYLEDAGIIRSLSSGF